MCKKVYLNKPVHVLQLLRIISNKRLKKMQLCSSLEYKFVIQVVSAYQVILFVVIHTNLFLTFSCCTEVSEKYHCW